MARVFISYSRKNKGFARRLAADLDRLGADVWIDVDDIPSGANWCNAIHEGLDSCEVMILVLSPDSMASRNVQDEWQYFRDQGRPLIPVLWQPTRVHFQLHRLQYIDFHTQDYETAFAQLHSELRREGLLLKPLTPSDDSVQLPARPDLPVEPVVPLLRRNMVIGVIAILLVIAAVIATLTGLISFGGGDDAPSGTLSAAQMEGTASAMRTTETAAAWTDTPQPTPEPSATPRPTDTPQPSPEPSNTPRPIDTPPTTPDPQQAALDRAQNFDGSNDDWEPFVQDFDGVEMVLVPAGCFEMGSEDGEDREQPVHTVCFDEPFWIDRYEVSQGQFAAFDGQAERDSWFTGNDLPRERITWTEARDFCELRGARLPTEAEWEYAARGPDALVYPWGDTFVGNNVIYENSPEYGDRMTAPPGGSLPGPSWVGAEDLSGNVWEWVSTIYQSYPYRAGDGREDNIDTNSSRVLRGGSFLNTSYLLRAAYRYGYPPVLENYFLGFRCARSAEG